MTVEFIQWSPLSEHLVVSDEYGFIDGHVRFCLGDDPEYAAEGYPPLSVVPEDGRAVFCVPNGTHWWNAWAHHAPNPVVFEVDDSATVYLGRIDHGRNQRVLARDALAMLHRMLEQVDPGARYPGNFDVLVPLAALPEDRFPRQNRQRSAGYTDFALACPQGSRQVARYSTPNNAFYKGVYESFLEAYPGVARKFWISLARRTNSALIGFQADLTMRSAAGIARSLHEWGGRIFSVSCKQLSVCSLRRNHKE